MLDGAYAALIDYTYTKLCISQTNANITVGNYRAQRLELFQYKAVAGRSPANLSLRHVTGKSADFEIATSESSSDRHVSFQNFTAIPFDGGSDSTKKGN